MSSSPSRTLIPVRMSRSEQPGLRCMGSGASVKSVAKSADVVQTIFFKGGLKD